MNRKFSDTDGIESDPGSDDEGFFSPEDDAPHTQFRQPWRILAVDDDNTFQRSLAFALRGMRILERTIELVQAFSMTEAANLLGRDHDFAVVLVDVVMETEDAGLRLIKSVRELLGLAETRFILLTGQPGRAPVETVMQDYDLSDYCLKSDLAARGLKNILTGAVRTYQQLRTISAARRGLQLIVESSNRLVGKQSLAEIAAATLDEIAILLNVPANGLVCAHTIGLSSVSAGYSAEIVDAQVTIGATGRFRAYVNLTLEELPEAAIRNLIAQALREQRTIATDDAQVLYFPRDVKTLADFAVFIAINRPLDDTERELLYVFAANVSKGFSNVALISRLDKLAYEDELLHIPNRSALLREIERARLQRGSTSYNLVLLDLDNFSGLNHLFGVLFGNRVLHAVAARLQQQFPAPSLVARFHSDLFAVLGYSDKVNVAGVQQVFAEPFAIDRTHYRLSACCAEMPLAGTFADAAELVRAAGSGLQAAQRDGLGSANVYDPAFEQLAAQRFDLMHRLYEGLQRQEFALVYQPQVDLDSGAIIGAEALLRWYAPNGPVPPDSFLPLAEQSVHIHTIGEIVVAQACAAVQTLTAAGFGALVLSINYSARQFDNPDIISRLHAACAAAGILPRQLCIEVTETAVMHSFQPVAAALQQHRDQGGTVAIDDFGTGLSSLEYLIRLPTDHLKIDRTFVARLDVDERSRALARTIITLGQRLGLKVVAEGVETASQAAWLRQHGCGIGQGWYFGRPLPLEELIARLHGR